MTHNHLFSVCALLDDTGTIAERYEYDAYGKATIYDSTLTTTRTTSSYSNPYTFTGRRLDSLDSGDLEIMYYRNRYYSPETGRFMTHDPLGIVPNGYDNPYYNQLQYLGGFNLYQYANFSPLTGSDPLGFICTTDRINSVYSLQLKKVPLNPFFTVGFDFKILKRAEFKTCDICCEDGTKGKEITNSGQSVYSGTIYGRMRIGVLGFMKIQGTFGGGPSFEHYENTCTKKVEDRGCLDVRGSITVSGGIDAKLIVASVKGQFRFKCKSCNAQKPKCKTSGRVTVEVCVGPKIWRTCYEKVLFDSKDGVGFELPNLPGGGVPGGNGMVYPGYPSVN